MIVLVVVAEESSRNNENELRRNSPEKQVTFVNISQEIQTEKEIQPQKQVMRYSEPPVKTAYEKSIINDAEMNDSNLSMLGMFKHSHQYFLISNSN